MHRSDDAAGINSGLEIRVGQARTIRHQSPSDGEFPREIARRNAIPCSSFGAPLTGSALGLAMTRCDGAH